MLSKYVSRHAKNRRLILIFTGWGMDWRPCRGLKADGYDIMVIWDYRELTYNWKPLLRYDEICLLAWSMGVFAASVTTHELLPRMTKRIAVNGTLTPVDDSQGIPEAIFRGTLAGLTPGSLRKFRRRMCTSAQEFAAFAERKPKRPFEEVLDELQALDMHCTFHVPQINRWDLAVISRDDAIFPAANQLNAWHNLAPVQMMQAGHLPDFAMLISRLFINKSLVSARFRASADSYRANATVQHAIAGRLYDEFRRVRGNDALSGNVIEVGVGDGTLTEQYAPAHTAGPILLWDIAGVPEDVTALSADIRAERCDAEICMRRTRSDSAAYILSASTLQWLNSPASFLRECCRVLAPGGWLVVSTFVQGNLTELSATIGTGLQLPTARAWLSMLPPEMEVLTCREDAIAITVDSPRAVLQHLRDTGVNAVSYGRSPIVLARHILENFPRNPDGSCTLTFRPVYLIARKTAQ